jgi:CelD/BcsL family acetyltransferase involved in cellulose biosynthesis
MTSMLKSMADRTAPELELEELGDPAALTALAEEWRQLWERCPTAHCFQRPEWLLPWMHRFFRGEKIWSLAIRVRGRLAGLAPLFLHRHKRDFQVRQVSFIGAGITDYLDFLLEPEIAGRGAALILRHLARHRDRWDICDLQELPPQSAVPDTPIPDALQAIFEPCSICPVLPLPAVPAEFEESLGGRFKNLRRTMHQLERSPGVEITAAGSGNWQDYLQDLFALHRARWQERRETGMLVSPDVRDFHFESAAGLGACGMLRAWRICCEGATVSVWYGFAARRRYYAYLSGFDPEFARISPGQVLIASSIRGAIAEGATDYDFLRKTEDFKQRWGASGRLNRRLLLRHAGSRLPDAHPSEPRP